MKTLQEHLRHETARYLERVMRGRTVLQAAQVSGVHKATLYRQMDLCGLQPNRSKRGNWGPYGV